MEDVALDYPRNSAGREPPTDQHNSVSLAASSDIHLEHAAKASEPRTESRNSVSRLSEGLEPIHISEATPLNDQAHESSSELDRLGVHIKDILSTIQRLEGIGLQQQNIPLPKIIVLGEQSTGKSSVIESISGIKTPRSTGTCTRCPLFINLESNSEANSRWTARVTLRRMFDFNGKTGRGSERRFPGWVLLPQPRVENFVSTSDPDQLEEIIRRAQLAIISPWTDPQEFLKPTYDHTRADQRCRFSPNIVCISITQADLPALSFYDLPGIVGQAEHPLEVKFVKDLVTEYVKDPEALILVTCAMDNDIANSTAGGIARQLKATDRCIGVLTKPDKITVSAREEKVQEIFVDKRFSFGHGYFVVRNLGNEQLNAMSHQDARAQEQRFFEQQEPWATASPDLASRLGTLKLQAFLSGKLAEQITQKLPIIQSEIGARLQEVEKQLKQFPEPPTVNASRIIYDTVSNFTNNVRNELVAEFPCTDWRNSWEALQKALFDGLVSLKPTMITFGRRDQDIYAVSLASGSSGLGQSLNDAIPVESEDGGDDGDGNGDVSMSRTPKPETPNKKRKAGGTSTPTFSPLKPRPSKVPSPDFSENRTKFQLDLLAEHLQEKSKSRIPGLIEPRVIDAEMIASLKHWELPLNDFFNTLEKQLQAQFKDTFDEAFGKWKGMALYGSAWKITMEMLKLNLHQQRTTMADESLNDEKEGPYIFHSDIFNREKAGVLQHYREARFKARLNIYKNERLQRTKKAMTTADVKNLLKDENFMAIINSEPYSVELDVAAQVTTYYMFAARRFHDSICMRIESKFFKQLRTQLRDELENGLGIHHEVEGQRNAIRLLAEQSTREMQRQELLAQITALKQGQQILSELENRKYGDATSLQISSDGTLSGGSNPFDVPTPPSENVDVEM